MKRQIFSARMDWFYIVGTLSGYSLGVIFANRVNKVGSIYVTLAGYVLILFLYFINFLISEISARPTAGQLGPNLRYKRAELKIYTAIALLSFLGVGSLYVLLRFHSLQGQALLWLASVIFCQFLLLSRPFTYSTVSYHWLLKSVIISPLAIFLGCTLQGFSPSIPLINLGIALFLCVSSAFITLMFRQYAGDLNRKQKTFLVSVSWEKGLMLHHILFAGSILAMVIYVLTSNSAKSNWPTITWQVFGLYEIYLLEQLAKGVKPNFILLDTLTIFRVLGSFYLLIYALIIY